MERFRVLIAPSAAKELEAVDGKANRNRIIRAIRALAGNPLGSGVEKLSGQKHRFRVRVGDCRVIYAIDRASRIVDVVKIGHRREVYR